MSRIAYVNGQYVPHDEAGVHIEDRGYQFADGVYEVIAVHKGALVDTEGHCIRLWRSLEELGIPAPMGEGALLIVIQQVLKMNRIKSGFIYLQITRGVARRDHAFPQACVPSLVITAKRGDLNAVLEKAKTGISAITVPDIRWGRCDIKSVALLPNVLAKQAALEAGAAEAIMFDEDGMITEGSSTNIWMVQKDGTLITRSTDDNILSGITRATVMRLAQAQNMSVETRPFSVIEAHSAAELFLTSTTSCAMPIVRLDGDTIAGGTPGPVATSLVQAYQDYIS